jgi:DNA repair protein RadC
MNSRNQVTSESVVAIGSVNSVHVHPCEVLRSAVVAGSPSVLVLHNHPSGDPSPSPEDRSLTDRIASAAALMGIRLLDHVILAADSYYSFSDGGEI